MFNRPKAVAKPGAQPDDHPKALAPNTLAFTLALSVAGSIIGVQIITTLGITPNTAIIGVLLAIAVSRIPVPATRVYRSIHVQNLAQSNISAATFAAANSLMVPIGLPALLGRPDLIPVMLLGATMGMLIDLAMLYWFFDSALFPAAAPWPPGTAAAEAILAGDLGGMRAAIMGAGGVVGIVGSSGCFGLLGSGISMSALGVAFIGNTGALAFFALGLLVRAYVPALWQVDLSRLLIPHGVMLGAGLVALVQAILLVARDREVKSQPVQGRQAFTRSNAYVRRALAGGFALYVVAALVLACAGGLYAGMKTLQFAWWIVFAAFSCVAAEFIVGLSAMRSGWFPAGGTALIFLVLGMAMGFPPLATALLVGFVASGGPAFADAGYDLKAGWHLRGLGKNLRFEMQGRREQTIAALMGFLTALVVVTLFHGRFFASNMFPPFDHAYVAAIRSGIDRFLIPNLVLWAIPGAFVQLAGGPNRQLGILFATGLIIGNSSMGWLVLAGILIRWVLDKAYKGEAEIPLAIFGAGCIAGGALWDFAGGAIRMRWKF